MDARDRYSKRARRHRRQTPSTQTIEVIARQLTYSRLLPLLRRPIRINAALDLRNPLLMFQNHRSDGNRATHQNRNDRNQQRTQLQDSMHTQIHSHPAARLLTTRNSRQVGGADRDRTGGLLVANQALSQLSYSPIKILVGLGRLELPTSPLSGVRSSHLSYRPGFHNFA
jgi:hypothetical protein